MKQEIHMVVFCKVCGSRLEIGKPPLSEDDAYSYTLRLTVEPCRKCTGDAENILDYLRHMLASVEKQKGMSPNKQS